MSITLRILFKYKYLTRILRGKLLLKSIYSDSLQIGKNVKIKGVQYISFGSNVIIEDDSWIEAVDTYQGCRFSPKIKIGNNVVVGNRNVITAIENISIGNDCLFAPNVLITDHFHGSKEQWNTSIPKVKLPLVSFGGIQIGNNVWVGYSAVILKGAKISNNSVISALSKTN